jgi:ribosomal protein L7/L12
MTPLLAIFGTGDHTTLMIIVVLLVTNAITAIRQQSKISQLEHQLHILIKQQKGEKPLSPEVELLANDPKQKIAAIKLHRDQNPVMSIADAKWDIENLA